MIVFQINTLYYFFYAEGFNNNFTATTAITSNAMISGLEATFAIVITASMFVSRLNQKQIFILCMVEGFIYALNFGICRWAIEAISGGGSITIWLFAYIFAAGIKKMKYP